MEDKMAMEGTLARCNEDREGTLNDLECANARRAASAIALVIERDRRETLERESERKLAELRAELERRERAEREALAAAEAARQAAYEAQWRDGGATPTDVISELAAAVVDTPSAPIAVNGGDAAPIGGAPPNVDLQAVEGVPPIGGEPVSAAEPTPQIPRPFREPDSDVDAE
jgi:hypothetical protein